MGWLIAIPLWIIAAKHILQGYLMVREQRYIDKVRRQQQEAQLYVLQRQRAGARETLH